MPFTAKCGRQQDTSAGPVSATRKVSPSRHDKLRCLHAVRRGIMIGPTNMTGATGPELEHGMREGGLQVVIMRGFRTAGNDGPLHPTAAFQVTGSARLVTWLAKRFWKALRPF
ncbi:hypothetical protein OPT61_g5448 [Boeremia exigua]|uniref:Uncharacterized protein n=1 Tax=Boeremia exigua TaxID=749465 RepID=A0ACC2IAC7_9PLEO|nr:hypothetical protein OPT61_g5448 [Boeremia exigua]